MAQFKAGWDPGSARHDAVKAWLVEQGFDLNTVPMDATITVHEPEHKVTVAVYERNPNGGLRLTSKTVKLKSEPNALVRGVSD